MHRLIQEYEKGGEDNLEDATESTAQGAQLSSLLMELEEKDVVDRGDIRAKGELRFALEPLLLK
jgi:hypothetical protein